MKIYGVQFDYDDRTDYDRLARVFEQSVHENCPAAELRIDRIDQPTHVKKNKGMSSNWHKFKLWQRFIEEQREGEHVVLMDVDMMVLDDLRPAFNEDFDIAFTRRTSTSWPRNGGVVFVKVGPASIAFVQKWGEIDDAMYRDSSFHDPYKKKYKGQNQASLGWMLEHNPTGAKWIDFPCVVWNACNEDWQRLDLTKAKVVHIKSTLRHYCLGHTAGEPSKMKHVCRAWKQLEKRAGKA